MTQDLLQARFRERLAVRYANLARLQGYLQSSCFMQTECESGIRCFSNEEYCNKNINCLDAILQAIYTELHNLTGAAGTYQFMALADHAAWAERVVDVIRELENTEERLAAMASVDQALTLITEMVKEEALASPA